MSPAGILSSTSINTHGSWNVYSTRVLVYFMYGCTWLGIHTRTCAHVSIFVRNSTNVTVMSQASRGGSLPQLINDTPPLMTAPTGQQNPRTLPLSSPSIYLCVHPSIHPYEHAYTQTSNISLSEIPGFVRKMHRISVSVAVHCKGSFLLLSR